MKRRYRASRAWAVDWAAARTGGEKKERRTPKRKKGRPPIKRCNTFRCKLKVSNMATCHICCIRQSLQLLQTNPAQLSSALVAIMLFIKI